jgi:ribonucleoside-diphosphate reductase alpha chain
VFDVFANKFSHDIFLQKYSMDQKETWDDTARRVVSAVCDPFLRSEELHEIYTLVRERKFIPAGRYLYAAGRPFHQTNNCFLFRAQDSREGWAKITSDSTLALMTGGGIGIDYSLVRPRNSPIRKTGGLATGPCALMQMVNEGGRHIMQGGQRRSAIWAGLVWSHDDVEEFMKLKDHSPELRAMKEKDLTFPLPMELTNISVIYDRDFFDKIENNDPHAKNIWLKNCKQAFSKAEPGMAFNYANPLDSLRNACTEVVSEDDNDKCNLGTVWMNRFANIFDFRRAVRMGTLMLLCGGVYSDLPSEDIRKVGEKNNRIGLGLGGMHEWLMLRGMPYEVTEEMHEWLRAYQEESDYATQEYCRRLGVAESKGKRAIAPNGTLGIIAETTTGIEPLFCKAYKRRFFKNEAWHYSYVVDGSVKRLIERGVDVRVIQDAYDIGFEQRVRFQADVQKYVDMAISSTCNMAPWGSELNNEGTVDKYAGILLKYAKGLRGFTCYPDGCRGGQPLTACSLEEAMANEGHVFEEGPDVCDITKGGVCGA